MLYRDQDVEDSLLRIVVTVRPDLVVSAATNLINSECENICKRNSGGISAAVSPIPVSISDSKLHHALLSAGICLQGRSREITTLQYLLGFVMLHGSCTQKVCLQN